MPIFVYVRADGKTVERYMHMTRVLREGVPQEIACEDGVKAVHSIAAEHGGVDKYGRGKQPTYGRWPLISNAMGVHPNQVQGMREKHPDHKFTPDGRMIFDSPQHRKKCLRQLGYVDLDGVP